MEENTTQVRPTFTVNIIIAIFAILAPAAYLIGLSYYQGFMLTMGIQPDSFPLSTQETYVQAYQAIALYLVDFIQLMITTIKYIFSYPGNLRVGLTILILVLLIYTFVKLGEAKPHRLKWRYFSAIHSLALRFNWNNSGLIKAAFITGKVTYRLLALIYITIVMASFWIIISWAAYIKGQSLAQERIDTYLEQGCHITKEKGWSNCARLTRNNKVVYQGLLVAISNSHIAFFTHNGSVTAYFPSEAVLETARESHKTSDL